MDPLLWTKAGHIIFVLAWMAGLLIYPRLVVYWIEGAEGGETRAAMAAAIDRTRKIILTPALIGTWLFALGLIHLQWGAISGQPWFWGKLAFALALSGWHGWLTAMARKVVSGQKQMNPKTLRMLNEIPFLMGIAMVILVVVEPFSR